MTVQTYDVQMGDAGGIQLVVDVDFLQLDVEHFKGLKNLIEAIHELGGDAPAAAPLLPSEKPVHKVPALKLSPSEEDLHKLEVVRYADECGSDSKAAKAFGIEDYRTIRTWRKELA